MSEPFIGEIRLWGCVYAPEGWALCAGGLLDIGDNTALYSLVGTTYGGDGRTTFGLPDLQGRSPMHYGTGPGLTRRLFGERLGTPSVPLLEQQIPTHDHIITGVAKPGTSSTPDTGLFLGIDTASTGDNILYLNNSAESNTELAEETLSPAGQSSPHQNMQPYIAMRYCIALIGIYPSRS